MAPDASRSDIVQFLFQTGSIKRGSMNPSPGNKKEFLFQTGSIKSCPVPKILVIAYNAMFLFQTGSIKSARNDMSTRALSL